MNDKVIMHGTKGLEDGINKLPKMLFTGDVVTIRHFFFFLTMINAKTETTKKIRQQSIRCQNRCRTMLTFQNFDVQIRKKKHKKLQ